MGIIKKVFLVIGVLVLCLAIWAAVMGDDGIAAKVWGVIQNSVNESVQDITGTNDTVIDDWSGPNNFEDAQNEASSND